MKSKLNGLYIFRGNFRNPESMQDKRLCDYAKLDKLYARWRACTQRGRTKPFACTKLRALKPIKTLSSSAQKLFKVASCFCDWIQIFSATRFDIHNLF